jgi:hypothetical protein
LKNTDGAKHGRNCTKYCGISLLELTKLPIGYFRFIIKTEARKMVLQQKKAASTKAAFYQI